MRPPAPEASPPRRPRRRRGLLIGVLAVIVAGAGVAAVALWKSDPSSSERVNAANGAPSSPKSDEERIIEAVEGFFRVDAEALSIPDPDHPLFTAYLTEPQLSASRDVVRQLADQGLAARAIPDSIAQRTVRVTEIAEGRALAEACVVDDGQVVYAESGEPAFEYPLDQSSTALFSAELVDEFGSWKIAQLTVVERWEGFGGCAVAAG